MHVLTVLLLFLSLSATSSSFCITKTSLIIKSFQFMAITGNETSIINQRSNSSWNYTAPTFSQSFLSHLEAVRNEWYDSFDNSGVKAVGEPSTDPSKMVQDSGLDSEWLDDYIID